MKTNIPKAVSIPIDQLDCSENLRLRSRSPIADQLLKESMAKHGQFFPVSVLQRESKFDLLEGLGRFRAAQALGWKEISCIVLDAHTTRAECILYQITSNSMRENFPPTTVARGISEYMEAAHCTAQQAISDLGFSSVGAKYLKLLELPAEVSSLVDQGKLPASCGYVLSQIEDKAKQAELAAEYVAGKHTRESLQLAVSSIKALGSQSVGPARKVKRALFTLSKNRSISISAPGLDLPGLIASLQELLIKAKAEKKRGITLDTFVKLTSDLLASEDEA